MVFKNVIDGDISWATRYATAAVILFRFELVLLFGPLYVVLCLGGSASILSTLKNGILTAIVVLGMLETSKDFNNVFSRHRPNRFFVVESLVMARGRSYLV